MKMAAIGFQIMASKVSVGLNYYQTTTETSLGLRFLLSSISKSKLVDVFYHDELFNSFSRPEMGSIIKVNGKNVFLDVWEYGVPTLSIDNAEFNFDLILKLQAHSSFKDMFSTSNAYRELSKCFSKMELSTLSEKIVPWTFFPSYWFEPFMGKEVGFRKVGKEHIFGFFCGKFWRGRKHFLDKLVKSGVGVIESDRKNNSQIDGGDLISKMLSSKYGIVLAGKCGECMEAKNRRELEYMIIGKPLILNYKPNYYNKLEAGKHYIYWDGTSDIRDLANSCDHKEILRNADEWYFSNVGGDGVTSSLLKILKDRCII